MTESGPDTPRGSAAKIHYDNCLSHKSPGECDCRTLHWLGIADNEPPCCREVELRGGAVPGQHDCDELRRRRLPAAQAEWERSRVVPDAD